LRHSPQSAILQNVLKPQNYAFVMHTWLTETCHPGIG